MSRIKAYRIEGVVRRSARFSLKVAAYSPSAAMRRALTVAPTRAGRPQSLQVIIYGAKEVR